MRTLVDIGEAQIKALDALAQKERQSRAALIRAAVDDYLALRKPGKRKAAFGIWKDRDIDGLTYQQRLRDEW